ncbi:hypothetical protein SDC9_107200 [bioreactor metagenome]|uniref:Uncharacterized protein n=1 Tax=bioreactor metagenome TaxID=1076179 RepID=A0A645B4J1_9ZZZZ
MGVNGLVICVPVSVLIGDIIAIIFPQPVGDGLPGKKGPFCVPVVVGFVEEGGPVFSGVQQRLAQVEGVHRRTFEQGKKLVGADVSVVADPRRQLVAPRRQLFGSLDVKEGNAALR